MNNHMMKEEIRDFEESKIDYKGVLFKYLKYWPWYFLSVIISLSLAYFKLRYTPNIYNASTTIKILSEDESSAIPDLTNLGSITEANVNIENEMFILRSYRMMEKVVKDQNLTQRFYNLGTVATTEIENPPFDIVIEKGVKEPVGSFIISFEEDGFIITNNKNEKKFKFIGNSTQGIKHELPFDLVLKESEKSDKTNPIKISLSTLKSASLGLQNRIKVNYLGKTSSLLKISMSGTLRSRSEHILNSLVNIYAEDGIEDKRLVDKRTIDFIDQRFITLAKELDTIEVDKKEFKQKYNLFDLESNASIEIDKERQTDEALFELENQMLITKMLDESLKDNRFDELLPNNLGIENIVINSLVESYNELIISRNRLLNSGGINNPSVIILKTRLKANYTSIKKSIKSYIQQLNKSLQKLELRNSELKKSVTSLPVKEKIIREIQRKQDIKESLFLLLLEKRETAAIKYAIKEPVIKVVDYALSKGGPISPNKKAIYFGAFILGILLPLMIVYISILFNTKIYTVQDIETIVNSVAPILGTIPLLRDDKKSEDDSYRGFLKESFRTLLTNIKFVLPKKEGIANTILVTSSIKGEGKTLISYNLASEVSSHKAKVILIGADLRNPQLHKYLDVENVNIGLSSYLNDEGIKIKDLEFYHSNEVSNLDILFAGAIPPNPTSLLSNNRFEELLNELKKTYDYIIIDSAPTLLVSDTLIFGKLFDTTIYVTRANHTEKSIVEYSKRLIDEGKLNNVAYVLNGVDTRSGYGYNYNYAYNYSYTYDDDEQSKKWYQFFKK